MESKSIQQLNLIEDVVINDLDPLQCAIRQFIKYVKELTKGTENTGHSLDVLYQKLYVLSKA